MADPFNPLTDQHCECLDECIRQCKETQEVLARARRAGAPMEEAEKIVARQMAVAEGYKREFFPGR